MKKNKYLIIGAAGFIGSNFSEYLIRRKVDCLLVDNLSYGSSLSFYEKYKKYFHIIDASNLDELRKVILKYQPQIIINFAAQSHVDRSISDPEEFIFNNLSVTYSILENIRHYIGTNKKNKFNRFINISTDEVYGSVSRGKVNEETNYFPNSPYSQSKASSDLLCRAYYKTYNIPSITLRLSNNYGPRQSVEKLIPNSLNCIFNNKKIGIYGKGLNIREWMYVEDTANIIYKTSKLSIPKYFILNISSGMAISNNKLIKKILETSFKQNLIPDIKLKKYFSYVKDRPGHDLRYAMDNKKFNKYFFKFRFTTLSKGITKTINWYIDNKEFIKESRMNIKG